MASITSGAISAMNTGREGPFTVQVLAIKTIPPSRVQVTITDGEEVALAMLASQLSMDCVVEGCLFQIQKFITSDLNGKKLHVILGGVSLGQAPISALPQAPAPAPAPAPAVPPQYQHHQQQQPPMPTSYGSYGSAQAQAPQAAAPIPQSYGSTKPMPSSYGGQATNNRPITRDDTAGAVIMPISALNPYSSRWTIKARVTSKSDIRRWSNAKGEGHLFSIDLLDNEGGEIRATFFKESCDKFYPMLEEGKVYTFSGGTIKMVQNRQYTNIKNHYELTFSQHSVIMAAADDAGIQKQHYDFVKIGAIAEQEVGATIDVIAIVRHASEVSEIVSTKQNGKVIQKRELTLVDDSLSEVRLTLWGEKATSSQYDWNSCPIVAFKGLKIGDYGGRSLSASGSTSLQISPDISEGVALHQWRMGFPNGVLPTGASLTTSGSGRDSSGATDPIESRTALTAIKDNAMGTSEKGDYATVKAYVNFIKHSDSDPWYTSCTNEGCNKKVIESGSNWMCEKCNTSLPECNYRYILNMSIMDDTGSTWVTAFNDQAEKLLGVTARELFEMRCTEAADYDKVFADCLFKPIIAKLRIKQEMVNDEMRTKSAVLAVSDIDYVTENQKMLDAINKYN